MCDWKKGSKENFWEKIDFYMLYKPQNVAAWVTKLRFSQESKYFITLYFGATANHQLDLLLFSCVALQPFLLLNPLDNNLSRTWNYCGFCILVRPIIKQRSCPSIDCLDFWSNREWGIFCWNICDLMSLNTISNRVPSTGLDTNCVSRGG